MYLIKQIKKNIFFKNWCIKLILEIRIVIINIQTS